MFTFLQNCKMEGAAVVIPNSTNDKTTHFQLVKWSNRLLKTNFKDVREMGSGELSISNDSAHFYVNNSHLRKSIINCCFVLFI